MADPVLIWGAGAIGATLGAYWARAGVDVLLVDVDAEHVRQCNAQGLRIEGPVEEFVVPVRAVHANDVQGVYARIVLAVKAQATEAAIEQLVPHLAEDGFVLSAQNGLNEYAIAARLGAERVMGAFVNFGADWQAPGRVLYGNRGAVVDGELDGETRERTRAMHALLALFDADAELSDDVLAYLWGKVGYGAMLFATALNHDSMHANFADPAREPVFIALGREAMAVARSQGVMPRGFNGFLPEAFFAEADAQAGPRCIAALAEFTAHTAKTHSGIWRDLSVRRRPTEAPGFFPPVLERAQRAGVATPVLAQLYALIGDVEQGVSEQSLATFMRLVQACSSISTASV